ncbi:hypothetical protein E2R68_07335 [Psychromonas sp. RZ22]|uniref:hypothetical protein n=1 Tax=Psychromonas algarum TaxID=2555643 RepID=UPI0010682A3C|nr:hypothetical protein [Psychromonas sp. RZ22]TEW54973.1 hypothetical protein E2R68_07335 [Psychromonas sp. RZ22]
MKLHMEEKCYTDICLLGKWFHHDHGQTTAYMLGSRELFELGVIPTTEEELEACLEPIAMNQLSLSACA